MLDSWLIWLALIAGVAVLAYCSWVSLQNLLQARLLFKTRALSATIPDRPGPAAVHGAIRILTSLRDHGLGPLLWYRRVDQVLRRRGRGHSWVTECDRVEAAPFVMESAGRSFQVEEVPTEVQETQSQIKEHDHAFLGLFRSTGDRRTILHWLSVPARVTVVGRLEDHGGTALLVKDNKVGLLVSPLEPAQAARRELFKGVAGLLGVTAAIVAGLFLYYSSLR